MSFSEDGNMVMPVAPAYGGGNGGFGCGWGDSAWWLIIILFALGGFGGYGMGGFGGGMGYDFPWLLNGQNAINANTNAGFDHAATQSAINSLQNSVTSGFGDVQLGIAGVNQNICQTGNGIVNALTNGFNSAEVANNARQIANMQQAFNAQTATTAAINGVQNSLADCCCENRLATQGLQTTIVQDGSATRQAISQGIQSIQDKLCQLELDGVKNQLAQAQRENVGLQNQINMATLRESQTAQNAFIQQGFSNEVDQLYNRLNSCPVPTTPVYGRTPIFTCNNGGYNVGCGCGM